MRSPSPCPIAFTAGKMVDMVLPDPVGACAVHLINGVWGTLAVGLFATDSTPTYSLADAEGNKSYFCASKEYIYIENPAGIESENGGCFPKTPKAAYCAQGELNSGKCYIEVNAKISK